MRQSRRHPAITHPKTEPAREMDQRETDATDGLTDATVTPAEDHPKETRKENGRETRRLSPKKVRTLPPPLSIRSFVVYLWKFL